MLPVFFFFLNVLHHNISNSGNPICVESVAQKLPSTLLHTKRNILCGYDILYNTCYKLLNHGFHEHAISTRAATLWCGKVGGRCFDTACVKCCDAEGFHYVEWILHLFHVKVGKTLWQHIIPAVSRKKKREEKRYQEIAQWGWEIQRKALVPNTTSRGSISVSIVYIQK